ncbi:MAG: hypothetical protein CMH60_01060 [Myxococcales bacterium]|nr:hypothetical protein [Myxococcales bacterium]|tara:strand:+ start:722 stop:1237 length:516 start_codon:yes stop_codon:yes gene_type:complete
MKIYRRVIPKIAKDILRSLLVNKAIEITDGRRDEAELDIAGVFVEYLNNVEQLNNDTKEALIRHGFGQDMYGKVKRSLASNRKLIIDTGAQEFILEQVLGALFNSENIEEIFAEDHELNKMISLSLGKYLGVDEELDREVRGRLKNLREGTAEWEIEYSNLIDQMRGQKAI